MPKAAEKAKKAFAGTEIEGKKLGIIGLGAIGVLVANAANRLGMEVYGCDPYLSVDNALNMSQRYHDRKEHTKRFMMSVIISQFMYHLLGFYERNV